MTAEVNVVIEQRAGALLIPADAVDAKGAVRVVVGGRVQRRVPVLGVHDMLRVEVLGGLGEGEMVIVGDGATLADGTRVDATEVSPAVAQKASAPRGGMSL